ncbi:MAG: CPBP family intramembrane metalloprotease [Actinomycetota bacterium]|jgi:membrane protease YdiL (CAAX protease family)|nr:CPBP family intramembrane metalloprotease [Rubrobacter sp.]MDQ3507040.1 CPBP family intramembrane metalloprotease [Actinomycetota bacterium]
MATAIATLVLAALVGGLGFLAQSARASRYALIALFVVLLAASALVSLVGVFVGVGFFFVASGSGGGATQITGGDQILLVGGGIAAFVAGILGILLCVPLLRKILGRNMRREFLADPPITLALWLSVMVLANNAVSFLIFTQDPDIGSLFPDGRISPLLIVASQLPFIVVAAMGVGIFFRRNLRQTLERLGYGSISMKHLGAVALFIVAALGLSVAADTLFAALQPDLYSQVGEISESLFDPSGLSPISAILFALLIGIGAGLGEETLFRGALQPALGIVFTSILFATLHVQYGPSLLLGYILLLSFGLGYIRKHINTTASFLAHAGYNTASVLLSYFLLGG